MSAQRLRAAAAAMRARAEAVHAHARAHVEITGGPDARWSPVFLATAIERHAPSPGPVVTEHCRLEAEHIASWHPAVALAVADLLDALADHADATGGRCVCDDAALAVADAYLPPDP